MPVLLLPVLHCAQPAFEVLELFLELLAVRASLIASSKEIPRDMVEVRQQHVSVDVAHASY